MSEKIKVHIHDNTRVPDEQKCLAEHELERGKVIILHMHAGECRLCPEGHCHHGSIGVCIGLDGSLMISFENVCRRSGSASTTSNPKADFYTRKERVQPMSESKNGSNESIERSRVESIYVERLFNLGNYENIKYGVRVAIGQDEDPGLALASLERIFNDLRDDGGVDKYELSRAKRTLEKPEAELDDLDKRYLDSYREKIRLHEEAKERRRRARQSLAALNYTSEHKDHKEDWADDGFDVEF